MSGKDPTTGRFVAGNRFWEARSSHGVKPKFDNSIDLWSACCEYFEWVEQNPLLEEKGFSYQGKVTSGKFSKVRAMTLRSLTMFIDVSMSTWDLWRDTRPDLSEVMKKAEDVIYEQKFSGAAADLLNPNIIARDLGLAGAERPPGRDDPSASLENATPEQLRALMAVAEQRLGDLAKQVNGSSDAHDANSVSRLTNIINGLD